METPPPGELPLATEPRAFFRPDIAYLQHRLAPDLGKVSQALIRDDVPPELASSFAITFYRQHRGASGVFYGTAFAPVGSPVRYSSHIEMSLPTNPGRWHDHLLWHEFGHLHDWATRPESVRLYNQPKTVRTARVIGVVLAGAGMVASELIKRADWAADPLFDRLLSVAEHTVLLTALWGAMTAVVPQGTLALIDKGEWRANRYAFRHRKDKILP